MNSVLYETEGGQVWHCTGWQSVDDALASFNTNSRIPVKEIDLQPKDIPAVSYSSPDSGDGWSSSRGVGRGRKLRDREFKLCPEKRDLILQNEIRKANSVVSNAHLEQHYNNSFSSSSNCSSPLLYGDKDFTNEIRFTRSPKKSKAVKKPDTEEELSDASSAVSGLDMTFAALPLGSNPLDCVVIKTSSCPPLNPDAPTFVPTENNLSSNLLKDEQVEPIPSEKSISQKPKKKAQMRNCVFESLGKQKGLKLQPPSHFLETSPLSPSIPYNGDYEYNEDDFPTLF